MKIENLVKLEKILLADDPARAIRENEKYIFSLIPSLEVCCGFDQHSPWHIYDVYDHILKVVELSPCNMAARYTALFHDVGKPCVFHLDEKGIGHFWGHWERSCEIFEEFAAKYGLDTELSSRVSRLIYYHDMNFSRLDDNELDKILQKFGKEEIELLYKIKRADLLAQSPEFHGLLCELDRQEARAVDRIT